MEFGKTLVNLPKSFRRSIRDNVKIKSKGVNGDDNLSKVTYDELVELRDNSKLIPGRKYRIIDFVTTVGEIIGIYTDNEGNEHNYAKYASANHPFDIVVTALDVDKLDEVASCLLHEGDTYFSHVNISAWEIKYCLDNDTNRFEWADPNGKGVIYHMKDDKNNECDYDFKNVLFCRCCIKDSNNNICYIGLMHAFSENGFVDISAINRNDYKYVYTFSIRQSVNSIDYMDGSIDYYINRSYGVQCTNNIIKNTIFTSIFDDNKYCISYLPNVTIIDIHTIEVHSAFNVTNNKLENIQNVTFNSFLNNVAVTGTIENVYFLNNYINCYISGNVSECYFGISDTFLDFSIQQNYIKNLNIKGIIRSSVLFDTMGGFSDKATEDIYIHGYISESVIGCINNVQITATLEGCVIVSAKNTQFHGKYGSTNFDDISNSYVNSRLENVTFNHILTDSNIQGNIKDLTFQQNNSDNITIKLKTNINVAGNNKRIGFSYLTDVPFVNVELQGHECVGLNNNIDFTYNENQYSNDNVTKIVYGICENKEFKLIRREKIIL